MVSNEKKNFIELTSNEIQGSQKPFNDLGRQISFKDFEDPCTMCIVLGSPRCSIADNFNIKTGRVVILLSIESPKPSKGILSGAYVSRNIEGVGS